VAAGSLLEGHRETRHLPGLGYDSAAGEQEVGGDVELASPCRAVRKNLKALPVQHYDRLDHGTMWTAPINRPADGMAGAEETREWKGA
jgi:hypothetical protein